VLIKLATNNHCNYVEGQTVDKWKEYRHASQWRWLEFDDPLHQNCVQHFWMFDKMYSNSIRREKYTKLVFLWL